MIGWGALLVGGAVLAASWYFSKLIIHPPVKGVQCTYDLEVDNGNFDPARWEAWPKEEVRIASPFGYELFGVLVPQDAARGTVILAHGVTYTLYGSIKYGQMFRDMGFNLLLYDHRNHGRSGGRDTSFGFYEKYDLQAWVDWVVARPDLATGGAGHVIGTHGESMGAATVLQHAGIDPRVAFVIADCPFANAADEFAYRLREEYHLPRFPLVPLASLITRWRAGWFYRDAAPLVAVPHIAAPVLLIHGAADTYIPPEDSQQLFAAKREGLKRLWLAPDARHAQSQPQDPQAYAEQVADFLEAADV